MFDFTDKVVIVTGASGNLGGAVARAYLAAGAR
jgi:NAD(P)-dependent dehydrogenase (short-subunit alcohol dehydrogenase family)